MARFRRINLDGKSLFKTETRRMSVNGYPGTVVVLNDDNEFEFRLSNSTLGPRLYLLDEASHEGKGCMDQIPVNHTAIGNYIEEGREFAARMADGTYRKDQSVYLAASGVITLVPSTSGTTFNAIGYVQEQDEVTITDVDLIRIRVQYHTVVNP